VHHGICGKEKGVATAQGRLTARFITNARVTSGGDMLIANEVVNSYLTCGGVLKVDQGTILAGHIIALADIHCHTAGSDAGARTIIEVGLAAECYDAIQKTVAAAEVSLQKAREIRGIVEPLMTHAKSLTAAQKEKATELLFAADEAEARSNKDLAVVAQSKSTLRTCLDTRIVVASLLHPGVIIRYPVAEALVDARWRGPVEIALQFHGSDAHVVVIDRCRNTATPLPNVPNADARMEFARHFLAGPAPTV
jgi:ribosomal protein L17